MAGKSLPLLALTPKFLYFYDLWIGYMADMETLGILDEIESLISDRLQVVSYKWLSRNFSVSSNAAKKLLQEFAEKHGHEFEVMYSVAGWLKKDPATYHIRLVPGRKLAEAKKEFDEGFSVQVYSVQGCIPKDPATIWNAEFIQSEELFKQPSGVDNCLRDNRFCGISNTYVQRNAEGATLSNATPQAKSAGLTGLAPVRSANPPSSKLQPSPKVPQDSSNAAASGTETKKPGGHDPKNEAVEKSKTSVAPAKKKGQSVKSPAGTEGSLANFWGRASTKSKSTTSSAEEQSHASKTNDSADAQVYAREALEAAGSDDESDVNFKRASNGDGGKKRRVVLDDSDEDDFEDAVNLGSPDPPKQQSFQRSKQENQAMDVEKSRLNFDEEKECKPKVKEEKTAGLEVRPTVKQDSSVVKNENVAASEVSVPEKTSDLDTSDKKKPADSVPGSPKRRKVLKTRIDERGREVTEVVWEGEETDVKGNKAANGTSSDNGKNSNDHKVKAEDNAPTHAVKRAPPTKKSPAVPTHTAGKAGNKKGAKDPKQGNIMSFFKKKV